MFCFDFCLQFHSKIHSSKLCHWPPKKWLNSSNRLIQTQLHQKIWHGKQSAFDFIIFVWFWSNLASNQIPSFDRIKCWFLSIFSILRSNHGWSEEEVLQIMLSLQSRGIIKSMAFNSFTRIHHEDTEIKVNFCLNKKTFIFSFENVRPSA